MNKTLLSYRIIFYRELQSITDCENKYSPGIDCLYSRDVAYMYNYFSGLKIVISIGLHIKLVALHVTNFFFFGFSFNFHFSVNNIQGGDKRKRKWQGMGAIIWGRRLL